MRFTRTLQFVACTALFWACSSDSSTGLKPGDGRMVVRLTDAPFSTDSVKSVDVFVVRVDGKVEDTQEADAQASVAETEAESEGWVVVAEPNESINLLALAGGNATTIGQAELAAGTYHSLRLILDLSQSSVTLKNDVVLGASTTPSILFPSAGHSGIKVILDQPITIEEGSTTTVLIDFDVGQSFVLRGNTIMQNGLLFKPVIHATITGS